MNWQFAEPTLTGAQSVFRLLEDGTYESRSLDDEEVQAWLAEQNE